jgi:anti-sigma B factor antagonist
MQTLDPCTPGGIDVAVRVTCGPDAELGRAVLAAATGHLDVEGATQLWDVISPRLSEVTPSLLLDLSGVDWLTSAGVGSLIRVLTRVQKEGGAMSIFGAASRVQSVLRIVALESILNVRPTAAEARARLRELGTT